LKTYLSKCKHDKEVAYEDLSCKKGFVVYPGVEPYPLGKNVVTLPVKDLAKIFCP